VFDHCEIHSKNGGYVTAASTPQDHPFGFVFLHCHLTGDSHSWAATNGQTQFEKSDVKTYLGRPWRPSASVAFLNCEMDAHIKPAGWHNWGNVTNETTARYVEYKNSGAGANFDGRVKWSRQLTNDEAKEFTIENILRGVDGWMLLEGDLKH